MGYWIAWGKEMAHASALLIVFSVDYGADSVSEFMAEKERMLEVIASQSLFSGATCLTVTIILLTTGEPQNWDTFEMSAAVVCALKVIPDLFLSLYPLCIEEPKGKKWLTAFNITNIIEALVEVIVLTIGFHLTRDSSGFKTRVMFVSYGLVIFYVLNEITEAITNLLISFGAKKKCVMGV